MNIWFAYAICVLVAIVVTTPVSLLLPAFLAFPVCFCIGYAIPGILMPYLVDDWRY